MLKAILLPKQIAVVKCKAHTKNIDTESLGNAKADSEAKKAAESKKETNIESINSVLTQDYFETSIQDIQN